MLVGVDMPVATIQGMDMITPPYAKLPGSGAGIILVKKDSYTTVTQPLHVTPERTLVSVG